MKKQHLVIAGMATTVTAILVTAGSLVLFNPSGNTSAAPSSSPVASRSAAPSPSPSPTEEIVVEPSLPPPPTPSKTTAKPKPKPKSDCHHFEGERGWSRDRVRAALDKAALNVLPYQGIKVPVSKSLVRAIAEQESGWQAGCMAADGGIGIMQLMAGTPEMVTAKFGPTYNVYKVDGNTKTGSLYLQWLTRYFGDAYDWDNDGKKGEYNLSPSLCVSKKPCLLKTVISAYNAGHGTVEQALDAKRPYPNPEYVDSVLALMVTKGVGI